MAEEAASLEPTEAERAPSGRRRPIESVLGRIGFLAAEVVVVFLGVWCAFLLDGCRERQKLDARRDQIHEALRRDFAKATSDLETAEAWFHQNFGEPFLQPLAAGERPLLRPIPIPMTGPDEAWNAILAAGGMDVLDLELIRAVETVLATHRWMFAMTQDYNDHLRTILVPVLDGEVDASLFYREDSDQLRGKYLWYYYSLIGIQSGFEQVIQQVSEVSELLEVPDD